LFSLRFIGVLAVDVAAGASRQFFEVPVNLLDALRRSIAAEKPARAPSVSERRKPPAPTKTGRRSQGRTSKRA
jgi:hypothetical protein